MKTTLKQYHYLYKITNLTNSKIYIGVHSTNKLDDGYFGGGVQLNRSIKSHGVEHFKKEILEWFDWRCEALQREAEIVNMEFIDSDDTYNMICGGQEGTYGLKRTEENKLRCRESKIGNKNPMFGRTNSAEILMKQSIRMSGHNNPFFCKKHSDESANKISNKLKGIKHTDERKLLYVGKRVGELNGMFGRAHSDDTKIKMRKPHKQRVNIKRVSIDGNIYESVFEAAKIFNCCVKTIRSRCLDLENINYKYF